MKRIYLTPEQRTFLDPTGKGYQHMQDYKAPPRFENLPKYFKQFDISDWFYNTVSPHLSMNGSKRHKLYLEYRICSLNAGVKVAVMSLVNLSL